MFNWLFVKPKDQYVGRVAVEFGGSFYVFSAYKGSSQHVFIEHSHYGMMFIPTDKLRGVVKGREYVWLDDPNKVDPVISD